MAIYLSKPTAYDPARALAQVLAEYPGSQQSTLRSLAEIYGSTFLGEPGYPPAPTVNRLEQLRLLRQELSTKTDLSDIWGEVQPWLDADLARLNAKP